MRRVLVVLLGVGMAVPSGAADRARPPGPAAAPPPIEHPFERWEYSSGLVVCQYFDPEHPTRGMCDRPESEHALPEVGGEPLQDGEGLGAGGGDVQ